MLSFTRVTQADLSQRDADISSLTRLVDSRTADLSSLQLSVCTSRLLYSLLAVARKCSTSIMFLHGSNKLGHTTPHNHNRFTALFRDHPGEPVPEENFWTLWCKERLTEADTLTIRLGATPSGLTSAHLHHPPIFFYGPDALPAAQPTVSKHWRQKVWP